ncbi:MAG: DUF5011 domain-containing protein [Lachnospiraceae bacterium]|nr:DUF5011 domain-containing protein [Lachnospiraceae bacterium]
MSSFKKVILGILGIGIVAGLCLGTVFFFYPELFGKEEEEQEVGILIAEKISEESLEESNETSAKAALTETPAPELPTSEEAVPEETPEVEPQETEAPEGSSKEVASKETSKEKPRETATPAPTPEPTPEPSVEETPEPTQEPAPEGNGTAGELVDRYAPVFLSFQATAVVKVGETFDVHKYVGYGDDVDRNVEITVTGNVNTSKEGTYPIKITLKDDAGHTTSKNMDVKVSSSSGGSGGGGSSSGNKENFADFIKNYKTDETMVGIDVSRWQETIDFAKVKAAGCEFVYMRLGGYDNGELYTDRFFASNLAGAKANGLKIGIYWHAEEGSADEIKASVNYLMGVLGGEKLDFPIAYDWEDYKNFETYGMNLYDLNTCYANFEKEIEARGYKACLYGSKNALETIWTQPRKGPSWLAHYTNSTSYSGSYFMWQHSCTGKIDGIAGDVDLDVFYPAKAN